jgi:hypothetical protein
MSWERMYVRHQLRLLAACCCATHAPKGDAQATQ